ncbi:hypothetical protein CPB85DRAFT_292067 [Mucidula mucida]|nr:hypothetical protein CPB85DRAFT_292067 [Mucidula mucida]
MDSSGCSDSPSDTRSASNTTFKSDTVNEGEATVGQRAIPTYTAPMRKKSKRRLGLKGLRPRVEKGIDPYDYEQKFPEDEKFKEMGPMARVWKTFLEEYSKFDSDMVEDWRDALDVLLVFAGLFSAVVSTFVAQSSQTLQVDFSEVTANLMFEVIHLQRAMLNGATSDEGIAHSALSPDTPVHVSSTSTFVNALWFTSLALSLTTALLAVLTKQWIHQYLATSSGTPRDRCRTRQFRYEDLKEWHVPLIIGILPVLMHVALGLFFGGLVVYVRALSTPIAIVVGAIAFFAFVSYFGTNLLPLFKPTCPYKTYLTRYSYSLLGYLHTASLGFSQRWHRLYSGICPAAAALIRSLTFKNTPDAPSQPVDLEKDRNKSYHELQQVTPRSLKALEKDLVAQRGHALDARALAGLHNISSNTSVQRIVLQALSILPIETVEIVRVNPQSGSHHS